MDKYYRKRFINEAIIAVVATILLCGVPSMIIVFNAVNS